MRGRAASCAARGAGVALVVIVSARGHTGPVRPSGWSLARQLLVLQALLLLGVVLLGAAAAYGDVRRDAEDRAREVVLGVAQTLAASPQTRTAMASADPAATLQPYAEEVRSRTGVFFVTFMAPDGVRYSHPEPDRIGEVFVGNTAAAAAGRPFTETYTGTLGPSVRAVVPVLAAGGPDDRVAGLVAVGISTESIGRDATRALPALAVAAGLAATVALAGAALVSRRLRRQTHGMGAEELRRLYEHHESVLHAVREGLVLVDRDGRVLLVNDAAQRLLDLPRDAVGTAAGDLPLPPSVAEVVTSGRPALDELHLTGQRVLVLTQTPALWEGRRLGTVVTVRDHTELQDLAGELDAVQALTESLRSQAHEAANRMHTVVSLLELGRPEEAVAFATAELELAQRLTDRVVAGVDDPVLSALLLGKTAQAGERGVELVVTPDTALPDAVLGGAALGPRDLVTVIGNLLDNAIDAAADAPPPGRVTVTARADGAPGTLLVRVADTGRGLDAARARAAFQRGWSTKAAATPGGRGLGLALVGQVVHRLGGTVEVEHGDGAVFTVRVPLQPPPAAARAGAATATAASTAAARP